MGSRGEATFEVQRGRLVRHVRLRDGRCYTQHCTLHVLILVAWLVEERGADGVTTNELWEALPDPPRTQISVALSFLKERGCVRTEGRRNYAASAAVYEDALAEFHYLSHLAQGGEPDDEPGAPSA
jgi:hypothetical protein